GRAERLLDILGHLAGQKLCRKDGLRSHCFDDLAPALVVNRSYLHRDLVWVLASALDPRIYAIARKIDIQHLALPCIGSPPLQAARIHQPLESSDPLPSPPGLSKCLSGAGLSFDSVCRDRRAPVGIVLPGCPVVLSSAV